MTTKEKNYEKLIGIFPDLENWSRDTWTNEGEFAVKFSSGGGAMMDLNLDLLNWEESSMRIALSHYYRHSSGDMIPDPDMEVEVNLAEKTASALTYQDMFGYQSVEHDEVNSEMLGMQLDSFLGDWLNNIQAMDYELVQEPEMNHEMD